MKLAVKHEAFKACLAIQIAELDTEELFLDLVRKGEADEPVQVEAQRKP